MFQTSFTPSSFAELLSGSYSEVPLNEEIDSLSDVHGVLTDSAEHQHLDHHQQPHQDGSSGLLPSFQETYAACTGVGFKMDEDYASPASSATTMATSAAAYHHQQHHQQQPQPHHLDHHHHHHHHQTQLNNHHHNQQQQQQYQNRHHELPTPVPSLIHFDYHFQHFPGALPPRSQPPDSPTSAELGGTVSVFEPMLNHVTIKHQQQQQQQQQNHHQQHSQVVIGHHHQQVPLIPPPPAEVLLIDTGTEQMQHIANNATLQDAARSRRMSSSMAHRNPTDSSTK